MATGSKKKKAPSDSTLVHVGSERAMVDTTGMSPNMKTAFGYGPDEKPSVKRQSKRQSKKGGGKSRKPPSEAAHTRGYERYRQSLQYTPRLRDRGRIPDNLTEKETEDLIAIAKEHNRAMQEKRQGFRSRKR